MSRRVLFLDTVHPVLKESLEKDKWICDEDYTCSSEELCRKIPDYTGLVIRSRFVLDENILRHAKKLKFIARSGSGMENIDLAYAESRGIKCINSPEGNSNAVGEHALGMLLALFNKINTADREVREGKWIREENRGIELSGRTLGILGYGHTGSSFAKKLSGFDCRILAYDKYKKGFGTDRIEEVSLKTLYSESDVLSIHIPYNADNHYIINESFINSFKKDFYLINTSRGEVLQTSALVKALKSGKISGVCLDVLEYEMKSFESLNTSELPADFQYLTNLKNVILTPHIAGWTRESYYKLSMVLYDKISTLGY